jgi:3D (Asp-Asp-Asp) domain-containing protein
MYATSYSPCNSGSSTCYYGTSSGIPVAHGVVAMIRDWYLALKGVRVYIPGYGTAVVADVGGGFDDGRAWIDLGYSDSDYVGWSQWVTVYFLAPAPLEVPWFLK